MLTDSPPLKMSSCWAAAVERARSRERVLVLGATDMGKSSFIRAFFEGAPAAARLIDLDPCQKMLGPPGTLTLGSLGPERIDAFVFTGSTSSSTISAIARGGARLADVASAGGQFIANTSGFVAGLGARLQAATAAALKPDLIVEIVPDLAAPPLIQGGSGSFELIHLPRSPEGRRKSPAARGAIRQEAFRKAISGAESLALPRGDILFEPGSPQPFAGAKRPVCGLANEAGEDVGYGILEEAGVEQVGLLTAFGSPGLTRVRLGRMWAAPEAGTWRLLDKLSPAWTG